MKLSLRHLVLHTYYGSVSMQRTLTEQQRAGLTSDFESLNLSKYVQEAVSRERNLRDCTLIC